MRLIVSGGATCLLLFLLLIELLHANDQVDKAIRILREKLASNDGTGPPSPQLQHTLAQLLESTEDGDLNEIARLFQEAGSNDGTTTKTSDGDKSKSWSPLPLVTRIQSLVHAAELFQTLGDREASAVCYYSSLNLVEDPEMVVQILRLATPTLILQLESSDRAHQIQHLGVNLCTNRFPEGVPEVHQFCGAVLRKLGYKTKAHRAYHMATIQPHPDDSRLAESLILASSAAREAGMDVATQLEYLQRAMSLRDLFDDILADLYNNMGIVYKSGGQRDQAVQYFRLALLVNPNDGHAQVQLASLNDDVSSVTKLDADYVSGLFDGYSARFERELVDTLQYKGHIMVAENLKQVWKEECSSSTDPSIVVDLGCGTGLLGEELARHTSQRNVHLVGVDLSQRMVDLARSKQTHGGRPVYAEVHQKDAVAFLTELKVRSIDAVVASDVFIYIGDLQAAFQQLHRCLVDGGWVGFTVELITADDEASSSHAGGMRLLPSGRFGHSRSYVQQMADRFGFTVVSWEMENALRLQGGTPVPGAVVVLQKEKTGREVTEPDSR